MLTFLVDCYLFSLCIVAGIALVKFSEFSKNHQRYFVFAVLTTLLIELTGRYIPSSKAHPNYWVFNIGMLVLFYLWTSVYLKYFEGEKRIINYIKIFQIVFLLGWVMNIGFVQGLYSFNTYSVMLMSVMLVVIVLYYFKSLLKSGQYENLFRVPLFWISTGLLVFYGICSLVLGTITYFTKSDHPEYATSLYRVVPILNIVMNCFFIIALLCQPIRKKYS